MDGSTITFIITLLVAFIFLRWFVASDDADQENMTSEATSSSRDRQQHQGASPQSQQRFHRPVNNDMIEVVQSVAPQLSIGQIRLDLQRSGSVQTTIERYLSEGSLPYPPGEGPNSRVNDGVDARNKVDNVKPENLLVKYGIDERSINNKGASSGLNNGSSTGQERASILQQRKTEMILNARKRLEAQLKNEQDISVLVTKDATKK